MYKLVNFCIVIHISINTPLLKICIRVASAACAIRLLRVCFIEIQLFEATYKNKKTCAYSQAASCGASLARSSATCSERL